MRLVLCHGCYDILHVGHLRHLAEARALGDRLLVSITTAEIVRSIKGQGHPAHTDEERIFQLMSLRFVDGVYVSRWRTGADAITLFRPHVYVRGADYAESGLVPEEEAACRAVGADVVFTRSKKRSVAEMVSRFEVSN